MLPSIAPLISVTKRLHQAELSYALGGSGLLYALGLVTEVNDWDLQSDETLEKLKPALQGLDWQLLEPSDKFKSDYLIQVKIDNTRIEIIGGFKILGLNDQVVSVPCKLYKFWNNIPLAHPVNWLKAYELMGRLEQAKLLKQYIDRTGLLD